MNDKDVLTHSERAVLLFCATQTEELVRREVALVPDSARRVRQQVGNRVRQTIVELGCVLDGGCSFVK